MSGESGIAPANPVDPLLWIRVPYDAPHYHHMPIAENWPFRLTVWLTIKANNQDIHILIAVGS